MNLQQRIQLHRLKRKPIQTIVLDDDFNIDVDDQNLKSGIIQIDSDQEYRKIKSEVHRKENHSLQQKTINIADPIRPKFEIECDEELKKVSSKSQPIIPVTKAQQSLHSFELVQNKIAEYTNPAKSATTYNTKTPQQQTPLQIAYDQFKLLKLREVQELKMKYQIEQEKAQLAQQKQLQKKLPITKQPNESISAYITRMVELMNKQNKKRYVNKKKERDFESENNNDNDLIVGIGPQIKEHAILLNYDVLYKTGKIIKYALQQPIAAEQNPMLALVKGRYAKAFIFNEEDFKDGPYGQKPRKIPKLPFPKHRLSLQPWEYYGVSPVEYFSTKNPYYTYKGKYVPQSEMHEQLPKPKSQPRYYSFDVDQLLAKRYSLKNETIQFQATFIGYKQKHWTDLSHLKMKCPQAVLNYEVFERNRIYSIIMNLKVQKVMRSHQYCILSHNLIKGRMAPPKVVYIKKENKIDKTIIQNLEVYRPRQQQSEYVELQISEEEFETNKRTSKQSRLMEEEWDPDKDLSPKRHKNNESKRKMSKSDDLISDIQQVVKQQKMSKNDQSQLKRSQKLYSQMEAYIDDTPSNDQFEILISPRSDSEQRKFQAQQTHQKRLFQKGQNDTRISVNQGFFDEQDSNSESPVDRQLTKEDMLYSKQLIDLQKGSQQNKYKYRSQFG